MKRYTSVQINELLCDKGFKLIGDYQGSNISVEIECNNGHRYKTRVANIINRGDRCSICNNHSSKSKYSLDIINEILATRHIKINDFKTVNEKNLFTCLKCNYQWSTSTSSVIAGTGCQRCYGKNNKLTELEIKDRLFYRNIELIGPYFGSVMRNTKFKCSKNHIWIARPSAILNQNQGCPECATTGFKKHISASAYILEFDNFIKFGITNDLKSRLKTHKRKNPCHKTIMTKEFKTGYMAVNWENYVKTYFPCEYVNKTQCPDGFTETISKYYLEEIKESLKKWGDHENK